MEKIKLHWLDIVVLVILGLGLLLCFIPMSPGEDGVYSLLSYLIEASKDGQGMRVIAFVFYALLTLTSAALLVYNQRAFFKPVLFTASVCMLLLSVNTWPTRAFSTAVAVSYIAIDIVVIVYDFVKRRMGDNNQKGNNK